MKLWLKSVIIFLGSNLFLSCSKNRKHLALVISCEFMWRISGVWSVGGGETCVRTMRRKQIYANPSLQGVQEGGKKKGCEWYRREEGYKVVIGA